MTGDNTGGHAGACVWPSGVADAGPEGRASHLLDHADMGDWLNLGPILYHHRKKMVPRWFRDDSIGFRRYNVSKSLGTFPENDPEHRHVAQVGLTASGATFCCNLIFQNVYQKTRELSFYYYCSRLCNKSDI